ncbi:PREDICTED: uncharacterized protein LOC104753747 [Camelina sativa]|uniref:Uncharacterized protein LOC104753747 n=1 Tax=Camelina sativa TaxID=90675 RepID=A0ABM0WPL7_CAMSA|nr:PREDICTED: uncharacterized protein LOC104753747 [Camelina sativa]
MDVLANKLDNASVSRQIGYHPRCKNIGLTHLSFADDLLIFSDGKVRSIDGIVQVFDEFAKWSGLRISMEKTTIYLAELTDAVHQVIAARFSLAVGSLPVRYLELPLVTKRLSSADYLPLIEHVKKKILFATFGWLRIAYRECIRSVEKLYSAYLWSGADLNTNKAKVAWVDVCKPKFEGRLGLRALREANDVCCLKLIWRIILCGDSLWVQWVRQSLLKNTSLWSVDVTQLGSWMWRKIIKYRDAAKLLSKTTVKDGTRTSFWFDNWSSMVLAIASSQWTDQTTDFLARYILQAVVYTLWQERNDRRRGTTPTSQAQLIHRINRNVHNQLLAIQLGGDTRYQDGLALWLASRFDPH